MHLKAILRFMAPDSNDVLYENLAEDDINASSWKWLGSLSRLLFTRAESPTPAVSSVELRQVLKQVNKNGQTARNRLFFVYAALLLQSEAALPLLQYSCFGFLSWWRSLAGPL